MEFVECEYKMLGREMEKLGSFHKICVNWVPTFIFMEYTIKRYNIIIMHA